MVSKKTQMVYVLGALLSWPLTSGMFFSFIQKPLIADEIGLRIAAENRRQDAGMSLLFGGAYAAVWPLGLPAAYLITGFAENGVWLQPREPQ